MLPNIHAGALCVQQQFIALAFLSVKGNRDGTVIYVAQPLQIK